MANTLANLARMYTETTGTGTLTLTTAVPSFLSFDAAGVANGATVTYAIYCGPHREIGAGAWALADFSTAGRNLVDDATTADQRTTLGLGTAATQNTGTSGATLPFLNGTNVWSAVNEFTTTSSGLANVLVTCVNNDAVAGPFVTVYRNSASPAANDTAGAFSFDGMDSAGNYQNYVRMTCVITSPTSGAESGIFNFVCTNAGTFASRVRISAGLYTTNATGGDLGADTINANTLYEAGTSLASKYAALASSNTFTQPQKMPSYTVAGLPAGSAGLIAFASNGRKNGEGAGLGTGVLVFHDGTAWRACDTGATVAA
jgi:hypothetical protein